MGGKVIEKRNSDELVALVRELVAGGDAPFLSDIVKLCDEIDRLKIREKELEHKVWLLEPGIDW